MDRNEFMEYLAQYYPDNMTDEQLDGLEQFCFKLFDSTQLPQLVTTQTQ